MAEIDWLAQRFEGSRSHLRGVAYRMLGSLSEADDAVQEAWLRLSRSSADPIDNLDGWLTTVVARICLDMLRSRTARREESLDERSPAPPGSPTAGTDPEQEALLADAVGLALLVVLETLDPAERLAFVLHDKFAVPFANIAPIVGRSPTATRQLASRARRRVQGAATVSAADLARQREVIDAFLAAARAGDFTALLAVLDPDVVLRVSGRSASGGAAAEIRGVEQVAKRATIGSARAAQPALVNGAVGVVVAPRGRLLMVLDFTIVDRTIVAIEAIANPARLAQLELAILAEEQSVDRNQAETRSSPTRLSR